MNRKLLEENNVGAIKQGDKWDPDWNRMTDGLDDAVDYRPVLKHAYSDLRRPAACIVVGAVDSGFPR